MYICELFHIFTIICTALRPKKSVFGRWELKHREIKWLARGSVWYSRKTELVSCISGLWPNYWSIFLTHPLAFKDFTALVQLPNHEAGVVLAHMLCPCVHKLPLVVIVCNTFGVSLASLSTFPWHGLFVWYPSQNETVWPRWFSG